MNSSSSEPVLPIAQRFLPEIVIVALDGGKETEPRRTEPPDLRHWQVEEFLRQTGKADNTQRAYRGQLIRFAAWCNKSWLNVTSSDIGQYRRELKLKGLKATSVNHALNTLKSFYQWLRRSSSYPMNKPLPTDAIDLERQPEPEADHIDRDDLAQIWEVLELEEKTAVRGRAIVAVLSHGLRACRDRRLWGSERTLYECLSRQPCEGTYSVAVLADPRCERTIQDAWLAVRFTPVQIQRPKKVSAQDYPEHIALYAVEAKEVTPPSGAQPIHWRLLTTHRVVCIEQALQLIEWYRWRWCIEQLFAILKRARLNLEATQLESAQAIQRLSVLALLVALQILQLIEGRDDSTLPATVAFSPPQQQCLTQLVPTLQGRTRKLQNPFPPASLPWATWLIARLGGWSGYASQSPPGIPTLVRGLRQFESIFRGWQLAQHPLVCTR